GLQHLGRDAPALVAHHRGGLYERAAAQRGAAAAEGAEALGAAACVAVDHGHVLGRDAERVGHDLRERRLVALAVRARAGDGRHASGALDLHAAALPAERAGLDVADDADADDLALRASRVLRAPQAGIVGGRQRPAERLRIVAGVVALTGDGLEGEP